VITKWVCGYRYDELVIAEIRGRETECFFFIDTKWDGGKSFRQVDAIFRYSNRLDKKDKRLFDTRAEAIQAQIKVQEDSRETLSRKVRDAADRIAKLQEILAG
jgi:hypothetical protein